LFPFKEEAMRQLGCLTACLLLAACSGSKQEPKKTITIGAVYDDTGSNANYYWVQARALAVAQMNAALDQTAHGKNLNFSLESRGDQNNKDNGAYAQQLARELAGLGARALFTDTSGVSGSVNGLNYDPNQPLALPIVCSPCSNGSVNNPQATSTDPVQQLGYQDADNWLRRTSMPNSPQVAYLMHYLFSQAPNGDGDLNGDGITKIAAYVNSDGAGPGNFSGTIVPAAQANYPGSDPTKLVLAQVNGASESADPSTYTSYEADLAQLAAGNPDYILVYVLPGFAAGIIQSYANATLTPKPVMVHSASSMRAIIVQQVGNGANGQQGIGNEVYSANASGTQFAADLLAATGAPPAGYDSNVYDAVVTAMLGVLKAALPLADPAQVATADVRAALDNINVQGAQVVGTGTAEFVKAIAAIDTGTDFNYEGASGPVDFDAVGNVRGNVAVWQIQAQKFVTAHLWDCVDHTADWTACPMVE
jgi:hypothetical protein